MERTDDGGQVRRSRKTTQTGRAKLVLILLAFVACAGGAAYALAQAGRSPTAGKAASKSAKSLSIRVAPRTRWVAPGHATKFRLRIHRGNRRSVRLSALKKKVKLRVIGGLPKGATAYFRPRSTHTSKAKLTIVTAGAASGRHRIRLLVRSGNRFATASAILVIGPRPQHGNGSPQPQSGNADFAISGDLPAPLEPGLAAPLDLALTNEGAAEIAISGLEVSVDSISAPQASATFPCTLDDFSVTQFAGTYGFVIPASSTRSLSELGFPEAQLPQVEMLDRPLNQNGCKGASLTLRHGGSATGGGE